MRRRLQLASIFCTRPRFGHFLGTSSSDYGFGLRGISGLHGGVLQFRAFSAISIRFLYYTTLDGRSQEKIRRFLYRATWRMKLSTFRAT